jgi:hypothetical protein
MAYSCRRGTVIFAVIELAPAAPAAPAAAFGALLGFLLAVYLRIRGHRVKWLWRSGGPRWKIPCQRGAPLELNPCRVRPERAGFKNDFQSGLLDGDTTDFKTLPSSSAAARGFG